MIPKHSDKKKKYLFSPELKTIVYQPNHVTKAQYDFSLLQERVFNTIIYHLQAAVKKRMSGEDYRQLSLFNSNNPNDIKFEIQLNEVTKNPQQYKYVKEALKDLAGVVMTFPFYDEEKKEKRVRFTGLFKGDFSYKSKRTSTISIEMDKKMAQVLIEIELDNNKRPINYTKFIYEIAQSARNKYTPRLYKLISSWKIKGQFTISLVEFRYWLGLEQKYKFYRDIEKNILIPVQKELENGDCWYDCKSPDFTKKHRNKVTHLNFRILTPEKLLVQELLKDNVKSMLRLHFSFSDKHINSFEPILIKTDRMKQIFDKLISLQEYIRINRKEIEDVPKYVLKCLVNEFG